MKSNRQIGGMANLAHELTLFFSLPIYKENIAAWRRSIMSNVPPFPWPNASNRYDLNACREWVGRYGLRDVMPAVKKPEPLALPKPKPLWSKRESDWLRNVHRTPIDHSESLRVMPGHDFNFTI